MKFAVAQTAALVRMATDDAVRCGVLGCNRDVVTRFQAVADSMIVSARCNRHGGAQAANALLQRAVNNATARSGVDGIGVLDCGDGAKPWYRYNGRLRPVSCPIAATTHQKLRAAARSAVHVRMWEQSELPAPYRLAPTGISLMGSDGKAEMPWRYVLALSNLSSAPVGTREQRRRVAHMMEVYAGDATIARRRLGEFLSARYYNGPPIWACAHQ